MKVIHSVIVILMLAAILSMDVIANEPSKRSSGNLQQTGVLAGATTPAGDIIPDHYIVVLKSSTTKEKSARSLSSVLTDVKALAESVDAKAAHVYGTALQGFSGYLTEEQVQNLRSSPQVDYVEPDRTVHLFVQTVPWGLTHIKAPMAHAVGLTGKRIKVGVIDTGIDYLHPDLTRNYAGGFDFVNNDADPWDDQGHGTHVAGTIAAVDNGFGVIGVAPEAELYGIKVLSATGGGSFADVIAGIDWAAANSLDVVNMSLGARIAPQALETACNNAFASGVVICAAAGNDYGGAVSFPAAYASCIAVSAIDNTNNLAFFSSKGPQVEVAGPGVNVLSTFPGDQYRSFMGTSMATPHVAGVAALIWATGNFQTSDEVRAQLTSTATDIGLPGRDINFGFGLVDVNAAIGGIGQQLPPIPLFSASRKIGCRPLGVQFSDQSSGDPTSWLWDFGDGTVSTEQSPVHWYFVDGLYSVILQVTNDAGTSELIKTDYVSVDHLLCRPPIANFSAVPTSGCGELSVSFSDSSVGAFAWYWEFGDGTNGTERSPTHLYTTPGIYTVTQHVFNYVGNNSHTKAQYVEVKPALTPSFSSDAQTGSVPLTVSFTDNTVGHTITSWNWDFGDGKSSVQQNPVHTYNKTGAFTVTLTVASDVCGTQQIVEASYIIVGSCSSIPIADFTASPTQGVAPHSVDFTDLSTGNPDVWLWSFGDGAESDLPNPAHIYSEPGIYKVELRIENNCDKDKIVKDGFIVIEDGGANGLSIGGNVPMTFELKPNYPNPFNPSTSISFTLPEASRVSLEIYNITGQKIVSLLNGHMEAGEHSVQWHASNHASGVYFYRLTTDQNTVTRKMMLIK